MVYTDHYSETLTEILKKLKKKNPKQCEAILKKISSILQAVQENPDHYKPLQHGMAGFKRVHIHKSFVLVFKVDHANRLVKFEDYDHHDNMYRKYR